MPEYRRFVAYFYEYIDGKKQKNTGFAKVELRNGMWRILFRIKADILPEPPVQVFGFVREQGYLLGFPMGYMPDGQEIAEEWAYGAERPIGHEKYFFADLSGIWIRSGDDRNFITVWDDDPVDIKKFVLQLPVVSEKGEAEIDEAEIDKAEKDEAEKDEAEIDKAEIDEAEIDKAEIDEAEIDEAEIDKAEIDKAEIDEAEIDETEDDKGGNEKDKDENNNAEIRKKSDVKKEIRADTIKDKSKNEKKETEAWIADLFQKRKKLHPFSDDEICDCIQIMPCDIVTMQQKGWQIGRSSFLQHGYYQHHHLLLGKDRNGQLVLGVPGIRNAQEQYMAQMFGYGKFKMARVLDCGKIFGYWCRIFS